MKHFEPCQLFDEINDVTSKWLSKTEDDNDATLLRLLSCIVPSASATQRVHIETLLKKQLLLNNNFPQLCFGPLYNIITNLKTTDKYICDVYWSNVLIWLRSCKHPNRETHKLLRICSR